MSGEGVFVYSDGQVGVRALAYDVFTQKGKMFDGRPVFVADGFKLEIANIDAFARPEGVQYVEEFIQDELAKLVREKYPNAIEVDRWTGKVTLSREEHTSHNNILIQLCARMLVAVQCDSA